MKPLITVIAGPTASGKTDLSIRIAQKINAEIISFDSRQCYIELNIGVARPSADQLAAVTHHFIANRSIHDPFSSATFAEEARNKIEEILKLQKNVVLCGGTGLYLKAVLEGFSVLPENSSEIREYVESVWREDQLAGLINLISKLDAEALTMVDSKNTARLKRTAEILLGGDNRSLKAIMAPKTPPINYPYQIFCLIPDRTLLYKNIDSRVESMIQHGLLAEVERLVPFKHLPVLKTVGYTELFDFLDGKTTLEFAVDKIKQHTRNYAKRQITWFKNQTNAKILNPTTESDIFIESFKS
jgi:tRNA dimethylallyltransferase